MKYTNHTKETMKQNSLNLLGDNPNHTFFAVTIRPEWSFIKSFRNLNEQTTIAEEITKNLITKYDAHLISHPNKPKNHHLKIIHHNAIETKTKSGSSTPAHSHGVWGIHDTHMEKWDDDDFHDRILELGSFQYEDQTYPLRKVLHSCWKEPFQSSLIAKTYPEGWLDYCYKWSGDKDENKMWGFVQSPLTNKQKSKKEVWDEPHTTNKQLHTGLRQPVPIPTTTLSSKLGTLQTKTHQGIYQRT